MIELGFEGHAGEAVRGACFLPEEEPDDARPGIVLVHEVYGADAHMQRVAERLASQGFAVLLPDLYSREGLPGPAGTPDDPSPQWTLDTIRAAVAGLPDRRALADLDAAARWLGAREDVDARSIAILGFCMGGTLAFLSGCTSTRFACVVDFYGGPLYRELSAEKPTQPIELHLNLDRPLLAFFGERDEHIPAEHVQLMRDRLEMAGKDFEIVTYERAGHGFFNDTRAGHEPDAAEDAWRRTLAFLRENL